MIGVCVFNCSNKNSFGYCKTTGCTNPDYINKIYNTNIKGDMTMNKKTKLSAPWVTFYREIEALFVGDLDVTVKYDENKNEIKLYVEDEKKADALTQLLPEEKSFGNVVVKISVIPSNKMKSKKASLFEEAFSGNKAFSYVRTLGGVFTNDIDYVVFQPKVVQFYDDNLGDINGMKTTLYQDIAKDVFGEREGVCFCTDMVVD